MFIDTHCHLVMPGFKYKLDPENIIKSSNSAGVKQIWLAGTNKNDNLSNIDTSLQYPETIKCWLGFHPEEYQEFDLDWLEGVLKEQETDNKIQKTNSSYLLQTTNYQPVVGVGEVGIDLNWHKKSTLVKQQEVFEDQIKLANRYKLPVAIHSRDAVDETIEVMERYKNTTFLWHCYNLEKEQTEKVLSLFNNLYFGFNAIITYKSGAYIMDSIKIIPIEKLLFETDTPFLAPRPFKYNYNTPEGVIEVYKFVSNNLNLNLSDLVQKIQENAERLLKNNEL